MRTTLITLAAAAVSLAGCATTGRSAADDATPEDRAGYVSMAAASDLFEIQSSQLALEKARSPEVREFAQMLVAHHTQTTATLTAAARASGMAPPPPALMPMQQRMIAELQQASADSFDRTYIAQQIPAHEMALALHRNYQQRGDTQQLRTAAASAVPIIRQHLDRARQLD